MGIYEVAMQYGIPPETVDAALPPLIGFLAVLILGKPLASIIIRRASGGDPGAAAMVWPITIASLILVPLASALSPAAGALSWILMLVVVPYVLGRTRRREEVQEIKVKSAPQKEDLRQKLLAKKWPAPAEKKEKEEERKEKKGGFLKLRLPFGGGKREKKGKEGTEERKGKEERKKGKEERGSVLVVEEIKLPAQTSASKATPAPKTPTAVPTPAKPAEAPNLPSPAERQRQAFIQAVQELEQMARKQAQPVQQAKPQPVQPAPQVPEKYVEEVARAVEERIVRTGKHRFLTWREVREARRRARETVKRVKPVVKKKVEETLAKKGRITKEDLDAIAEEIFYQVQKGDVFAEEKPAQAPKPKKERAKRKKKGEEESLGGEEDLLALLSEEGGEEEAGGGEEDMDELLKLLGE